MVYIFQSSSTMREIKQLTLMKWIQVEGIKLLVPSESRISKDINILTIQYMD